MVPTDCFINCEALCPRKALPSRISLCFTVAQFVGKHSLVSLLPKEKKKKMLPPPFSALPPSLCSGSKPDQFPNFLPSASSLTLPLLPRP